MPKMSEIWIKNIHHAKMIPPGYKEGVYHLAGVMYYTDDWNDRPIILQFGFGENRVEVICHDTVFSYADGTVVCNTWSMKGQESIRYVGCTRFYPLDKGPCGVNFEPYKVESGHISVLRKDGTAQEVTIRDFENLLVS